MKNRYRSVHALPIATALTATRIIYHRLLNDGSTLHTLSAAAAAFALAEGAWVYQPGRPTILLQTVKSAL